MMRFLEDLAARRRFGMKPGLDTIAALCAALGSPERQFKAIHIAGTNGKGAVASMLDACLRQAQVEVEGGGGERKLRIGRYTSPHLVKLNERFFLDGAPVDDATLDRLAERVAPVLRSLGEGGTFFEALTAVAFLLYAEAKVGYAILETGLGGRLDATNVCDPALTVITKIGLDHCDWLGNTIEQIAAEKAGIIKPSVPIVLGRNEPSVQAVIAARAKEVGAPYYYAPDLATDDEIPSDFALAGSFNRENAITVIAALKVVEGLKGLKGLRGLAKVVWPGRFQCVGSYIVDGAHNPPAARALAESLANLSHTSNLSNPSNPSNLSTPFTLIFGACGDKDVTEVLSILKPHISKGYAVRTNNPRSLAPEDLAAKMNAAGIPTVPCASLAEALALTGPRHSCRGATPQTLICGSLFLAGEALVALKAYPWPQDRFDPSERLTPEA